MPIWSYPRCSRRILIDNPIFQIAIVVLFGAWFLGWSGTLFLSSTRMIFAAAFDRILPGRRPRYPTAASHGWPSSSYHGSGVILSCFYATTRTSWRSRSTRRSSSR